ncbi:DUF4185 domain-containing protein [Mycolicibacterium pulveris]|nr:DUF4185 domain-containing protein [Mycolicibacterium pulveris]MCV6980397.1 DUF4185 domain-containing protein [Mycolicibacterium pulveris]
MGAAAHIGRVGGLAVALGVGTAIATGHGVALADDSTDSAASTSSAESSSSPSAGAKSQGTETPPTTDSSTDDESTGTTGVVTAQTNTGTSPADETTDETTEDSDVEDDGATQEEPAEEEPAVVPETPEPEPVESEGSTAPPAEDAGDDAATTHPSPSSSKSRSADSTTETAADQQIGTTSAGTADSLDDPATPVRRNQPVAQFVDARVLAAASLRLMSPKMAATSATADVTEVAPASPPTPPQDLFSAVTTLVSNVVNWVLNPLAGTAPTTPTQPALMWGLLAFARREFESFLTGLSGQDTAESTAAQTTTSLALAAAAANPRPGFPTPGQQLSPSTMFIDWVTGNYPTNNTAERFGVWGTDVGVMWDNGMTDDPSTPWNEHQVLIAVGDTFSGPNMSGIWRLNTLFRSSDYNLADGMTIPAGEWFNGNMFGGAPLSSPTFARQIIHPAPGLPTGVTLIPTAGISVPTPDTQFGATQYVSFMSVSQWGAPGHWTTNYSAIAYSTDNGENWTVAPTSVRYNNPWSGHQNFQQSAFVRGDDGYVYVYGTPNGRQGAAHLARVPEKDILDLSKYEYYNGGSRGWFWSTPAGWYRNDPGKATPVFGVDRGACGVARTGNQVSEMSVQYNEHLGKYVVLHADQFNNIVMRTADRPEGAWSGAKVLMTQQNGGIYAPMMHPWSPSTLGTGSELYWNLSLWSEYNVMLMSTDLDKV